MTDSKSAYYLAVHNEIVEFLTLSKYDLMVADEIDSQSEDAMDRQHNRIEELFRAATCLDATERDRLFQVLMDNYTAIKDDADWKCSFAEDLHKDLERCLTVLDDNIAQFKQDLEDAEPGITGIIERKVAMEVLAPQRPSKKRPKSTNSNRTSSLSSGHNDDEEE